MKTALEIIDETEQYYSDPAKRGVDSTIRCLRYSYITAEGKMCAVGRCALNPKDLPMMPVIASWFGDGILKPEYRGQSLLFWSKLQWTHDCDSNFTETGISEKGKSAFQALRDNFK